MWLRLHSILADKFFSDAIALNTGADDWERNQVDLAYQAAQNSGTGLKLFSSFDLTLMACDLGDLVYRVNKYANHPNQFKVNGKPMISSYSGDCLGNSGWARLKAQTNGYLMPFIWGLENHFNQWPSMDSWYWWGCINPTDASSSELRPVILHSWGCAWPQGDYPKNVSIGRFSSKYDNFFFPFRQRITTVLGVFSFCWIVIAHFPADISQLGTHFATTVSAWMLFVLLGVSDFLRNQSWRLVFS